MWETQHGRLFEFLRGPRAAFLTKRSIKELRKAANATETQATVARGLFLIISIDRDKFPTPTVYVRWAYSQTPQIPLSKRNHMASQLFSTSCVTVPLRCCHLL